VVCHRPTCPGVSADVPLERDYGATCHLYHIRIALATMKRGNDLIIEYVSKAQTMADDMALAGKKIDDEELISYLMAGLNYECNSVVYSLVTRPDELTIGEVYSQLMIYEQRIEQQQ
jgi:hypothetical protein